jgi:hypothetical protein
VPIPGQPAVEERLREIASRLPFDADRLIKHVVARRERASHDDGILPESQRLRNSGPELAMVGHDS